MQSHGFFSFQTFFIFMYYQNDLLSVRLLCACRFFRCAFHLLYLDIKEKSKSLFLQREINRQNKVFLYFDLDVERWQTTEKIGGGIQQ